jgi:hypothetical protein
MEWFGKIPGYPAKNSMASYCVLCKYLPTYLVGKVVRYAYRICLDRRTQDSKVDGHELTAYPGSRRCCPPTVKAAWVRQVWFVVKA